MAEEQKTTVVEPELEQASIQEEEKATEKTFTQSQLDEIIQKEKAKAKRSAEKEYQAKNKKHTLLNWKLKSTVADLSEKPLKCFLRAVLQLMIKS